MLQSKDIAWQKDKYKVLRHVYMKPTGDSIQPQDIYRMKVMGCKNEFHVNNREKGRNSHTILTSDIIDFKTRKVNNKEDIT